MIACHALNAVIRKTSCYGIVLAGATDATRKTPLSVWKVGLALLVLHSFAERQFLTGNPRHQG